MTKIDVTRKEIEGLEKSIGEKRIDIYNLKDKLKAVGSSTYGLTGAKNSDRIKVWIERGKDDLSKMESKLKGLKDEVDVFDHPWRTDDRSILQSRLSDLQDSINETKLAEKIEYDLLNARLKRIDILGHEFDIKDRTRLSWKIKEREKELGDLVGKEEAVRLKLRKIGDPVR